MKKLFFTLLFMLVALTGNAQVSPTTALAGSWSGKLNAGLMSLTVVLHLEQADGYVTATLDSPDQGAKGIPASIEFLNDDSVAVKIESIGMTYRARLKEGKLELVKVFPISGEGVEILKKTENNKLLNVRKIMSIA